MKDAFERRRFVQQHFVGRISSELFDPGHRNYLNLLKSCYDICVYLDDQLQDNYLTADPSEGFYSAACRPSNFGNDGSTSRLGLNCDIQKTGKRNFISKLLIRIPGIAGRPPSCLTRRRCVPWRRRASVTAP